MRIAAADLSTVAQSNTASRQCSHSNASKPLLCETCHDECGGLFASAYESNQGDRCATVQPLEPPFIQSSSLHIAFDPIQSIPL